MELLLIVIVFGVIFYALGNRATSNEPTQVRPPGWRAGRDE
jgi:hypothetical protein